MSVYSMDLEQRHPRISVKEVTGSSMLRSATLAALLVGSLLVLSDCESDSGYNPDRSPTGAQIKKDQQEIKKGRALGRADKARGGGYSDPTQIPGLKRPPNRRGKLLTPYIPQPSKPMPAGITTPEPSPIPGPSPSKVPDLASIEELQSEADTATPTVTCARIVFAETVQC